MRIRASCTSVNGPACTPGSVPEPRGPFDGHLSRRHVAVPLQRPTRGLGEPRRHPLSDLAPGEVYRAGRVTTTPVVSYTTLSPLPRTPRGRGGLLSVALSRGLLRVGVTHRPALWSPDVPRHGRTRDATVQPTHSRSLVYGAVPRRHRHRATSKTPPRIAAGTPMTSPSRMAMSHQTERRRRRLPAAATCVRPSGPINCWPRRPGEQGVRIGRGGRCFRPGRPSTRC